MLLGLILLAGCVQTRNSEPRTAADIFFDTTESIIGMFETTEFEDEQNRAREISERRRQWQCENLNEPELRKLGINCDAVHGK